VSPRPRQGVQPAAALEATPELLDGLPMGVFRATPAGRMLAANLRVARMMGYERKEDFIDVPVPTLYADPAERARWQQLMAREGVVRNFEALLRRRDGTLFWGQLSAHAHRSETGEVLWYDGVVEDITERKTQEEAFARTDAMLRAVFDTLTDAVIVVSWPERRILHVNRACERIYGHTADELRGRSTEVFHVDVERFAEFGRLIGKMMAEKGEARLEWPMRRRSGEVFPTEQRTALLRGPGGEILGGIAIARDMSEQKRAEQELEEARARLARGEKLAAMGSLVAGVAHEIRTPLAYLANHAALLERRLGGDPAARESLEAMQEGVQRINAIVTSLRRHHHIDAAARRAIELPRVVDEAVALFRATRLANVLVRHEAASLSVRAEPIQVQQVVLNLLENAADATPQGGRIEVVTSGEAGFAVVAVRDEGAGVDEQAQARLFEPFFTTKPGGTGLGLSIVRRLVEAHGGRIEVRSRRGEGATFLVRLPRLAESS
jgi:PAS domain S-box-containing protein